MGSIAFGTNLRADIATEKSLRISFTAYGAAKLLGCSTNAAFRNWNDLTDGQNPDFQMEGAPVRPTHRQSRCKRQQPFSPKVKMVCAPETIAAVFPPPKLSIVSALQHLQLYKSEFFLRQKYEVERCSIKQIAEEIFSSRTAVSSGLKSFGIPIRLNDRLNRYRSQVRFGERVCRNHIIENKREIAAIQKMTALRQQGFSYWKIAETFNALKIPTKTRRGLWHARSIQQVLQDHTVRIAETAQSHPKIRCTSKK